MSNMTSLLIFHLEETMTATTQLRRAALLLLFPSFVAASKPLDTDRHASVWTPEFPTHYETASAIPKASPISSGTGKRSKIALRYEPNIVALGLSGDYYGDISLGTPPQTFTVRFGANTYLPTWVANFP